MLALRAELEELRTEQGQRWSLPEQQAAILAKVWGGVGILAKVWGEVGILAKVWGGQGWCVPWPGCAGSTVGTCHGQGVLTGQDMDLQDSDMGWKGGRMGGRMGGWLGGCVGCMDAWMLLFKAASSSLRILHFVHGCVDAPFQGSLIKPEKTAFCAWMRGCSFSRQPHQA